MTSQPGDLAQLLRTVRLALQQENYPEAINALEQAVALATEAGDHAAQARHLGNLALIYYRGGQPEAALAAFDQALTNARADGDRLTEDGLLGNKGNVLRELRRYDEAISHLNQALLIAQEIGDVRGRGIWLSNLGLLQDDLGKPAEAIPLHREAAAVARSLRDQRGLATRLIHLSNSHLAANEPAEAIKALHECVVAHIAVGDKAEAAYRMATIGNINTDLGRASGTQFEAELYYSMATDAFRDALALIREIGDPVAEADLLYSLGSAAGNRGQIDPAIVHFSEALRLYESLGLSDRAAEVQHNLDLARQMQG